MTEIKFNVLIAEDEENIGNFISAILKTNGYKPIIATTGNQAIQCAESYCPDVILLDLGLPDMDGIDVISEIRKWAVTPIIVISARNRESEKVKALDAGADDYITKPFGSEELMARIRCALRYRRKYGSKNVYEYDGLKVDYERRLVIVDGKQIHLTPVEYRIMEYLTMNSGKVVTYQMLLEKIWGPYVSENNKILRVNMTNIRRKIGDDPAEPKYIFTESGVGYRMAESED